MKKISALLLTLVLSLSLVACSTAPAAPATAEQPADTAPTATSAPAANSVMESLVGPWELATEKIEGDIYTAFGSGVRDQGAAMELTSDGKVSFHIGLNGGEGTYEIVDDDDLIFRITDFNEGRQWTYKGEIDKEMGVTYIEMEINDFDVYWKMQ